MTNKTIDKELLISEIIEQGIIYGHKKSRTHPKMKPYIVANRNEIEILDPEMTVTSLNKAIEFLKEIVKKKGLILCVSVKPSSKATVKSFAQEFEYPYVTNRWFGGILTNFEVISKRIKYYQDMRSKKEKDEFAQYTKKEQHRFGQELEKLVKTFDGLQNLTRLPDVVFMVDASEHKTAIQEARHLGIPIVAIIDNDDDPTLIDYPIIANDHSKQSVEWLMQKIKEEISSVVTSDDDNDTNEDKNDTSDDDNDK